MKKISHPKAEVIHPGKSAKAAMQMSISSTMIGVLFFILTFILTFGPDDFNFLVLVQLVLAIPLLYMANLGHSKTAYRQQGLMWDAFSWYTSNTGNVIILNAIGLMVAKISHELSAVYFGLFIVLMAIYSIINIKCNPHLRGQKIFKLFYFLVVTFFGGVFPLLIEFLR